MSDHAKPVRDAVTAVLVSGPDAGKVTAVIMQHLSYAARAAASNPKDAVVAVVRSGFTTAAMGAVDLAELTIQVLQALPNTSLMVKAGPEDLMSWVMEGAAQAAVAAAGDREKIATHIEEKFMGAGQVFESFFDAERAKGA
jgi:hypothetical protein